jgi:hypothetical protein
MPRRHRFTPLGLVMLACLASGAVAPPASAAPRNDDFRDAVSIKLGQTHRGTTVGGTLQKGERLPLEGGARSGSVWYRFRTTGRVSVLLKGSCRFDRPLFSSYGISVYTGRSLRTLRVVDAHSGECPAMRVAFTARPGRSYSIRVAGWQGKGRFSLNARAFDAPPNDDFADAARLKLGLSVIATLRNATLELGESASERHSVWYTLRVARTRKVVIRAGCGSNSFPFAQVFTGRTLGRLSDRVNYHPFAICSLRFTARRGIRYRIQVTGRWGESFTLSARAAQQN